MMNSRTGDAIDAALAQERPAFVAYLPVGFPSVDLSIKAAQQVVAAGADVIELGFPYSDPTMDGAVIQHAAQLALDNGLRRGDVFRAVEEVAESGAAVLVMTYYNPVFKYGVENFSRDLHNAGGAGLITPDLIPEEAAEWIGVADNYDLDKVFLIAPSSTDARIKLTCENTRGFVYAASRMGVTGVQNDVGSDAPSLVQRARSLGAQRVGVGIGVSNAQQAHTVGGYADAVIVGSALVQSLMGEGAPNELLDNVSSTAADIFTGVESAKRAQ
ncbi:tryptophan synthase subunit alpha [Arcanobacterium bovis]|uniref:Tryptophan synthase alpha chain n=1 Tax=Arcanobacterium bovis TaxID=2529275 RepID=A0A4Q9V1N8_9ACTO|nr:tryptophan synthase subunit alpha [Arcanobacterium bovis]TBW22963.1 tryptophan synthase subunit alpha [Arcanobacterium bovis]